ncbi:MAG: hypothetical protein OXI50_11850, partial [Gammaproteobacteria bacterium]|nr:hypothetical protein [Gammaproteobacteria bacterium]
VHWRWQDRRCAAKETVYGSDGNTTSLYTPTLDGLGAVGAGAHASHEHVVLERMPERAALVALLLAAPSMLPYGAEA